MIYSLMESMVPQRLRRGQVYCADFLAKDLLVAAQVSATVGSRERDGGHLVLGEARWRK
jgi:hypothetical protein